MRSRTAAGVLAVAVLAAACSNASGGGGGGGGSAGGADAPGVTSTEIKVGGLAAQTGPLAGQYAPIWQGVEAYFDMVNAAGGVNGRKLVLASKRDDDTSPARDVAQARALVENDHVFAVVGVATPTFAGGRYLAEQKVPTFGWNVNPEWSSGPTLFGDKGSFLDFTSAGPQLPFLAGKVGAHKVGTLAYTASQSRDCSTGQVNGFKKFGFDVVFQDTSLPFGATDLTADVARMKSAGLDFISTCMDPSGNTLLSRSLAKAGLTDVTQYWPNGYSQATLDSFGDLMEGVYLSTFFVPFQRPDAAPGMAKFLAQMHKLFPDAQIGEVQLAGWINADLFVTGLRKIGPDVSRSKLVDAINAMTNYTAGGIVPGIDWTVQHTAINPVQCTAFIQVQHGKFVSVYGEGDSPFVCFHTDSTTPIPVPTGG